MSLSMLKFVTEMFHSMMTITLIVKHLSKSLTVVKVKVKVSISLNNIRV